VPVAGPGFLRSRGNGRAQHWGTVDYTYSVAFDQTDPDNETTSGVSFGGKLLANGRTLILHLTAAGGRFSHAAGTFMLRSGSTLAQVYVNANVNNACGGPNRV
jgi:hypothetical protein